MKHCSKEQEKCSFSLCVGEDQGQVSESFPCWGGTDPFLPTLVDSDPMEPFVPDTQIIPAVCGAWICVLLSTGGQENTKGIIPCHN